MALDTLHCPLASFSGVDSIKNDPTWLWLIPLLQVRTQTASYRTMWAPLNDFAVLELRKVTAAGTKAKAGKCESLDRTDGCVLYLPKTAS